MSLCTQEQVQSDRKGVTLCSANADALDSMQCNDEYVCGPLTSEQVYLNAGVGTSSDGSVLFDGAAFRHTCMSSRHDVGILLTCCAHAASDWHASKWASRQEKIPIFCRTRSSVQSAC